MTSKQRVLEKYAAAYSASFADCWVVFRDCGIQLGEGKSEALAWKDAANTAIREEGNFPESPKSNFSR